MGGRIGGLPLLALAEGQGAKGWVSALLLGLWLMVKRVNIRSGVSALFLATLVAGYWGELHGTEFWTAGKWWGIVSLAYLLMPNLLAFGQESEEFGVRTIAIAMELHSS